MYSRRLFHKVDALTLIKMVNALICQFAYGIRNEIVENSVKMAQVV